MALKRMTRNDNPNILVSQFDYIREYADDRKKKEEKEEDGTDGIIALDEREIGERWGDVDDFLDN
jgi:hypothetical protein